MTTIFTPKKIISEENTGATLKQARAFKGLSLEQISQKIKIKTAYLEALEENDYANLPSGLYSKSYLKKYAVYLGLNYKQLKSAPASGSDGLNPLSPNNPFSQPLIKRGKLLIFPKIIRNLLVSLVILICCIYLAVYVKKIFFAPLLIISQPEKNLLTTSNSIEVVGQTEAEAEVRINDELVLNNNNGHFSKLVTLKKGLNNIVISAQKKYSQTKTVTRQILIK